MSHVTGGGLAANLERVLPVELDGDHRPRAPGPRSRSSTWSAGWGGCAQADLEATLNCGVGMVAAGRADDVGRRDLALLAEHGIRAWVAGEVAGDGRTATAGSRAAGGPAPRLVTDPPDDSRRRMPELGVREQPAGQVALPPR